jgi:hypothetical protein
MKIINLSKKNDFPAYNAMKHMGAVQIEKINNSDFWRGILCGIRYGWLYIRDQWGNLKIKHWSKIKSIEFREIRPRDIANIGECIYWIPEINPIASIVIKICCVPYDLTITVRDAQGMDAEINMTRLFFPK